MEYIIIAIISIAFGYWIGLRNGVAKGVESVESYWLPDIVMSDIKGASDITFQNFIQDFFSEFIRICNSNGEVAFDDISLVLSVFKETHPIFKKYDCLRHTDNYLIYEDKYRSIVIGTDGDLFKLYELREGITGINYSQKYQMFGLFDKSFSGGGMY
ncbi:hypothetical protein SHAb15599_00128 [Acinetobacter phage SH-Ab 15599]|nr:hypothetical protein SHAb15599_00128 [Acinetobacter phage SH-Ab 15599]